MNPDDIATFDPTVAELNKMVEATKGITATDLTDKNQLETVRTNRIALKNARVKIEKRGKELREDALKFQKAVIAKEKELVGIIAPEEDRLAAIEDEAKQIAILKARTEQLPARKERLAAIGDAEVVPDEYLLAFDDTAFETYLNTRTAARLAAEQNRIEVEKLAIEHEKRAMEIEKEARDREEKARNEERAHAEALAARKEQERVEADIRAKEEAARKEQAERDALEKASKYRAFREKHGWSEETKAHFKEEKLGSEIVLWKKLGTFNIK